ncbi:LacI family DNA-binding transcriptional regulator [Rathayibacter festucae]|uniref:LacI family DNA-binding transcriptional regulator n=1 Tax=Rathayibacter festucae TaxID=110937 RepID=UPI002A6AA9BF|nr:LacI family DNA-binding transcriptional regulator [Rathayibacter festucae]MDY0912527.1 LacI family DNA-binding transcriptional regulator [Rathayibacter festucae]
MRATVRDVATRAGVSPKTVSNVINGVVFVRPDTRERVEAAIAELHYVPNLSARGLRNGRSGAIALAFPDLTTEYSAAMLDMFVEAAHERGWSIQMEQTGRRPDREGELLSRAREHLIDGLVLNPVSLKLSAIVGTAELPPIVVIGEVEQDLVDRVAVDSVAAAREMTEHLLARGHRRIAVVGTDGPDSDRASARARTEGYREALAAAGVPHDPALEIMAEDWVPSVAGEAFARALDAGIEMDAVFCFTDSMAVGVLSILFARHIRVPEQIAVAGFDDVRGGRFASPPLTTVSFDKRAFAETTLSVLAERIADRSLPPRRIFIPHEIIARASTATDRAATD